jgi:DNA-binding IclR family transcriptional regulator
MTLKALAAAARMPASKAHRYLVSLIRANLVEQHEDTGLYDLGALTLSAGLTKLSRLDSYRVALDHLASLHRETEETVMLGVWNGSNVVAVRWLEAKRYVSVVVRLGSTMPVISSATGRVFAAFLPESSVRLTVQRELKLRVNPTIRRKKVSSSAWWDEIRRVRTVGLAQVEGDLTLGISSISAPVFDHQGKIVYAFTLVGPSAAFDTSEGGPLARSLLDWTGRCTNALGGRPTDR